MHKIIIIALFIVWATSVQAQQLARQVVSITVTSQSFDHDAPWKKLRVKKQKSSGCYLGNGLILTESHSLKNHVLVEISKLGNNKKYPGTILVKDYFSGLALLTVKDTSFYKGLVPAKLAVSEKLTGKKTTIAAWDSGGTLKEYTAESYKTSIKFYHPNCPVLMHHMITGINKAGNGEPVFINNRLTGLVTSFNKQEKTVFVISVDMIRAMLFDIKDGRYDGFPFFWLEAFALEDDTHLRSYLGLKDTDTGLFISKVPSISSGHSFIKTGDVIVTINGFSIDDNGTYISPVYGRLNYHGIFLTNCPASGTIPMEIIRDRKKITITVPVKRFRHKQLLIPEIHYDTQPAYLVFGGLAFQELTRDYLKTWGSKWSRKADKRLLFYYSHFASKSSTPHRKRFIILNRVFPASCNIGYHSYKYDLLKSINGKPVIDLRDLKKIIDSCKSKYITFEFIGGKTIVLNKNKALTEEKQILKRYNIHLPWAFTK